MRKWCTKLVRDYVESDDQLDQIYKITTRDQDWINPMMNGWILWDLESSSTSDLDEELEHWQNCLHEVSTLRCNMMTKSLWCVLSKVGKLPYYDGLTNVDIFLDEFEHEVPKFDHFQALELALCATPTWWWGTHKDNFNGWQDPKRHMEYTFFQIHHYVVSLTCIQHKA